MNKPRIIPFANMITDEVIRRGTIYIDFPGGPLAIDGEILTSPPESPSMAWTIPGTDLILRLTPRKATAEELAAATLPSLRIADPA